MGEPIEHAGPHQPSEASSPPPAIPVPRLWIGVLAWLAWCGLFWKLDPPWGQYPAATIALVVAARAIQRTPRLRRLGAPFILVPCAIANLVGGFGELPHVALTGAGIVLLLLSRHIRIRLFGPFGLDPQSLVHATTAAIYVTAFVVLMAEFIQFQALPGEPTLVSLKDPFLFLFSYGSVALAGVGFLLTRDFKATLARLDLRPIAIRQVAWSAAAAGLFITAQWVLDHAGSVLFPSLYALEERFPWDVSTPSLLLANVLLSMAAGIGEEALYRGAIQPRLGIVATALLFAGGHTHYQLAGILAVFLMGLAYGVIKERTSTTFVACIHVFHSIGLDLLGFLAA